MNQTTIAVIVPVYNRAGLVREALDAIIAQETPATEIIVVDDGSTDDTPVALAAYAGRVKTIRISNSGDLVARNVGLRAATSRFTAFCDSDDLWRPGFLTAMIKLWEKAPTLMTAYGNFNLFRDEIWESRSKFDDAPADFWDGFRSFEGGGMFERPVIRQLLKFQPFFPSAMMVDRTAFLEAGGWDESASRIVGSDFATALRAAERPMGILHQPLVGIRRHGGNISNNVMAMNLGDAQILERLLDTRPALTPYRADVLNSIARRRADAADTAFDLRDFASVRRIQKMLPASHRRSPRRQVKRLISCLPQRIAQTVAAVASRVAN